eukprot:766665-Hanusia_phi.AAC.1
MELAIADNGTAAKSVRVEERERSGTKQVEGEAARDRGRGRGRDRQRLRQRDRGRRRGEKREEGRQKSEQQQKRHERTEDVFNAKTPTLLVDPSSLTSWDP